MNDLFISTTTFGVSDKAPLIKLEQAGISYSLNPYKRKLLPEETATLAQDSIAVVAGIEDLELLVKSSENLKIICRLGVGLENVPFDLCQEKNIKVSFTPDAVTPAISELTISLMLAVARKLSISDKNIRMGNWNRQPGVRIGGSTIGLIGFGRVGQKVAKLLLSFQPKLVLVYDPYLNQEQIHKMEGKGLIIKPVALDELLKTSDIVSLHVGLNDSTRNMISGQEIGKMKNDSILINTSRGGIVNEYDLFLALKKGDIGGAALDVFEEEPYNGPLTQLDNVLLSPHQGSATKDCRAKMEMEAVDEVTRFIKGKPLKQEVSI